MYIPDYLLFEPKQFKEKLTTEFTGNLDVPNALKGNPRCWKKQNIAGTKQKKTILINDFRLEGMDEKKIKEAKHFIDKLIQEGFSIYLWQKQGPIKLDEKNSGMLFLPLVRNDCSPAHPHEMTKAMASKNIPTEGLIVMDIAALVNLQNEIQDQKVMPRAQPNEVDIRDIAKSTFSFDAIKKAKPDIRVIAPALDDSIKPLEDWFNQRNEVVSFDYRDYIIDTKDKANFYFSIAEQVKNLRVQTLEGLSFKQILEKGANLETIKVSDKDFFQKLDIQDSESYPSIRVLDLSAGVEIENSMNNWYLLMNKMPNLKRIVLFQGFLDSIQEIQKNGFPKEVLQKASIEERVALFKLLEELKAIEHLTCKDDEVMGNEDFTLTFSQSNQDSMLTNLTKLQTTPNLESLTMTLTPLNTKMTIPDDDKNILKQHINNKLAVLNLEVINKTKPIEDSNFHFLRTFNTVYQDITHLAHFAPHLQYLKISMKKDCQISAQEEIKSIPSLKAISIDAESKQSLKFLSKLAPNLESLELNGEIVHDDLFSVDFHKLRTLSIKPGFTARLTSNFTLGALINQYPKLENVEINGDQILSILKKTDTLPKNINLKKLSIDFPSLALNPESHTVIVDIVKRANHLTELNLKNCKYCSEMIKELSKTGAKLNNIRKIDFTSSNFTLEDYVLLRQMAPHLESITITYCPASNHEDELRKDKSVNIINKYKKALTSKNDTSTDASNKQIGKGDNEKKRSVDANVLNKDIEYDLTEIFTDINGAKPPHPNQYRLSVFNTIQFTPNPESPFDLLNLGDLELKPYQKYQYGLENLNQVLQIARKEKKQQFQGKHTMLLTNTFAPLPSLSANEVLQALNVQGLKQSDIEVKYSTRDNLYYIRRKTFGLSDVNIDFLIEVQEPPISKNKSLQEFVKSFNAFGVPEADIDMDGLSGEDKLKRMYEHKVGRCELRALMFKHFAKEKFPEQPVRIITNDCHAFVEVLENKQWIKYDLGGYPAKANIKKPDVEARNTPVTETSDLPEKSPVIEVSVLPENPVVGVSALHEKSIFGDISDLEDDQSDIIELDIEWDDEESLDPTHVTWGARETIKLEPEAFLLNALSATKVDATSGEHRGQNVLVQCENDEDVQTTCLNLQHMAKHTERAVFVINNPEEIVCASRWLRREKDDTGTPMTGPGGPLHEFLTAQHHQGKHPVLIVNWNNFSADELVRFNTLIDENRSADKTHIPNDMVVVGIYNTQKPNAYTGSDFYSRNTKKCFVKPNVLPTEGFALEVPETNIGTNAIEIELYESINWRELLLGQWVMEAGRIQFNEGPLAKALEKGLPVHLRNAPWHIPEFAQFWQEAKIHGKIPTTGNTLQVPVSFWENLNQSKGYDWKVLLTAHHFEPNPQKLINPFVINPGTFNQFIDHYDIQNDLPQFTKSVFSKYENKEVNLLLTSSLSAPNWHQLLKEAKRYNVTLHIGVPEEISLPESLEKDCDVQRLNQKKQSIADVTLIVSSDVSMTAEKLKLVHVKDKPFVIDVSECDNSDIFYSNKAKLDEKENNIAFETKISDIWTALQNNQTVILKGRFKAELTNACMEICSQGGLTINGKFEPLKGKLILLSDAPLSTAFESKNDTPDLQEKIDHILANEYSEELQRAIKAHNWPKDATFAQIKAAINQYQRTMPPHFDIQEGILKIATKESQARQAMDFSDEHVDKVCNEFIATRLEALKNILSHAPFAFIGGKTGVGKSTFMKRYITPENGFTLYNEIQGLENWANNQTRGTTKVLFFDEANISDNDYTLFEGLYEIPPRILINGKLITLTEDHKVVLAGNPMSYGGERHLPTLLSQHGNACTFDLMPIEYIYRDILKPVFDAAKVSKINSKVFSECILTAYQDICAFSEDEVLISPRELKMMAMMMVSSILSESNHQNIVYEVASQCLPDDKKEEFKHSFLSKYPKSLSSNKRVLPSQTTAGKNFTLTPSRVPIYDSLLRLLAVRETMITSNDEALKTSGLGGMILEGEPGTGKSHFLIDVLMKQGYQPFPTKIDTDKVFYIIPASMSFEEKKNKLIDAFEKGLPIVIDEINSTPMMEQLLNSLLMGEHPITKKASDNPGFFLLATQNPISMAGRQATSQAIKRRVLFHEFKAYNGTEMQDILIESFANVPLKNIQTLIRHHLNAVRYAKAHHLEPAPVFRDLYKIVEKIAERFPKDIVKVNFEAEKVLIQQNENVYRAPKITHSLKKSRDQLTFKSQIQEENIPPTPNLAPKTR
ncbi:hypothetical protein [Candidatus Berkiella aquae]|uniref:ATPase dynein-related AAA domain-containing protein n=1 Tax=Candidatus Berkiella aquae TaxID=295108 RepID=A0A0Q9YPD9_9GAMM|nr:hypothetical protein [Candidatus Berkiella aquae]MCS5711968.1 hypothetical protein [Candidatus Berkiella aquae]